MIKAAVIGAGHFAYRVHIPELAKREDVVLDSVCRRGTGELELIKQEFGFAFATQDWRQVLERDIDIAVISTPHHLHYEQAMAFLERGAHVLVEKPMCLDPAQAWQLDEAARKADRQLVVAYGWHYKPRLSEVRGMIEEIGSIEHVMCHFASFTRSVFSGAGGISRFSHLPIQPSQDTWQDPARGGGFAWGQLSHALGLLYWLTKLRGDTVQAIAGLNHGIDLHDSAIMRFNSGATATLSGSCGVPDGHGFEVDIRLYGPNGCVTLDIEQERAALKRPNGRLEVLEVPRGTWSYSCEGPVNALADLAQGFGKNQSDGNLGARTVETLHALIASVHAGGAPQTIIQ